MTVIAQNVQNQQDYGRKSQQLSAGPHKFVTITNNYKL